MSRDIEKFRTRPEWPSIERWVDPPPGVVCDACGGDMFLYWNGVTYICSECPNRRQKSNQVMNTPRKSNEWYAGYTEGFEAGVKYEADRRKREENIANWKSQNSGLE